jgi:Putative beta-barrel porin-2, OmpL-like. bbp2/Carboxypeptidase regulatory-like domain
MKGRASEMETILRKVVSTLCVIACAAMWFVRSAHAGTEVTPGPTALGSVYGVTRNSHGQPMPKVKIFVHAVEDNDDRNVVSGVAGTFVVENLKPGHYQLVAMNEGLANPPLTSVDVAAGETVQADVTAASGRAAATAKPAAQPGVSDSAVSDAMAKELEALKARIEQLELQLKVNTAPAQPATSAETMANASVPAPAMTPAPTPPQSESVATPAGVPAKKAQIAPFSDWDWTWLNGNPRNKDTAFDSKFFTPEIRADLTYNYDFNKPKDDSEGGSSELFRSNELQLEQLGIGGDFHLDNVRARFMTQFGMYSTTTPRNDPSPAKGQWDLSDSYRYVSEAYGGYHINALDGINIDAGIFMSYIGLFSYYNFDNWAYQPSYVSSNTPWFFNGLRIQIFPNPHLKIEPWIINGWQSYGSSNSRKGVGGQIKWTPRPWINVISNNYGLGHDDLYIPNRARIHTDNSVEIKYYDKPGNGLDKMAFSFTGDLGCEFGGGVSCYGDKAGGPKQSFIGYMLYNRMWFHRDLFGLTLGGGQINNPGRYLVLLPPVNGESAASAALNSPYFTENPGDPFKAWDASITLDYMPKQWITFRWEYDYRHASVPYWSGAGGVTPPPGSNNGFPSEYACNDGTASALINGCGADGGTWFPDLRKDEQLFDMDLMVKF